jgi:hypothetical protein
VYLRTTGIPSASENWVQLAVVGKGPKREITIAAEFEIPRIICEEVGTVPHAIKDLLAGTAIVALVTVD